MPHEDAWSLQHELPVMTAYYDLPEPISKIEYILMSENIDSSQLKAWVYAVGIEVDFNPKNSGQWDTIPGKGYVWRMGIRAANALSLNLFIENYRMQPGMTLYVYNEDHTERTGPFDTRNNKNGGTLPVQSLPGNSIIIEWNIPLHLSSHNNFTITNVGYGFREIPGQNRIVPMAVADGCNVDINCKTGNHWQREKRSVVRMETTTRSGGIVKTQYCTGTLVNQAVATEKKKPYILTANHCVSTNTMAQNTVFVFSYEKELCNGISPPVPRGIPGSTLRATKKELDFALLELSENIVDSHNPYYAGWNISTSTPASAVGIHHPQGDVKKISVENDPLGTGTFTDEQTGLYCDKDAHWVVKKWDIGVTEKGSSGSPIFDPSHLVVGCLSGGKATCLNPVNDYYAKFCEQWNKYPTANENLRSWLDPDNKVEKTLWGYDPIAPYEGRCDTLSHIGYNETQMLLKTDNGYLTSQNGNGWISFAEKIRNDTVVKIIGLEAHVAKVHPTGSKVRFSVWQGDQFPVGDPVYMKDVLVQEDYQDYPMHVYFEKTLEITGNYYIGYSVEYGQPVDTFAVYQSAKRPYEGISAMHVEKNDGTWMALEDDVPPVYSSLGIKAIGQFGKEQTQPYQVPYHDLKIVFQPGNDIVFVYFADPAQTVYVECYDTSGKRMPVNELNRYIVMYDETTYLQVELNVSNLSYGMYFIKAFDNRKVQSGKFIRL